MRGDVVLLVVGVLSLGSSLMAYLFYYLDKRAAMSDRRRVPEITLHLFALLGGWPGALLAQRHFRHKTRKVSFRWRFWLTLLMHAGAVAWLALHSYTSM